MLPAARSFEGGFVLFALAHLQAPQAPAAPKIEIRPEVTRAEIEAHVRYLASDELAGRKTGTQGAVLAAHHLADTLKRCGVEPAGDGGSFLQAVPVARVRASAVPELSLRSRAAGEGQPIEAVFGQDFEVSRAAFDRQDLRVLVAASASGIPAKGDPEAALFLDTGRGQARRWLEEAGHPNGDGFALVILAGSDKPGEPNRKPSSGESITLPRVGQANESPRLTVRGTLLERFRRGEIESLSLRTHVVSDAPPAFNVVGRIPGAGRGDDQTLAEEAVVVSAHYDHLGTREAGSDGEDLVYNGADDDASGCAAVLEIAGALASGKKPARTVIFLLATGEEVGLLGTIYYLDHPAVPLERTIANLNVEMIGRPDALVGGAGKLWLTGFERTDLGAACSKAGLEVLADPRPDQHFFERSDNYAFVMRGIVGQTFSTYDLHDDYHHVSDEADLLDYDHMEKCVVSVLGAVRLVADGELHPRWTAGFEPKPRPKR
ncbi:MAG: M28 family peptidase [Planctomycetota bacterium]